MGMNLKETLDTWEKYNTTKPQFSYRTNRFRFDTALKKTFSVFSPRSWSSGWITKGALTYMVYYYFFKRTPHVKHWNREGYYYETAHKAPKAVF